MTVILTTVTDITSTDFIGANFSFRITVVYPFMESAQFDGSYIFTKSYDSMEIGGEDDQTNSAGARPTGRNLQQ